MEDLERVPIYPVLPHVPPIPVIINVMTRVLNGVEMFPVKVNKHKLGFSRALCWDDFRL